MLMEISKNIFLFIFPLIIAIKSNEILKNTENEIILSLVSHLKVPRCIFLSETRDGFKNVELSKRLSSFKIFAASLPYNDFERMNKTDIKVMVIVKIENMEKLTEFLKLSRQISLNHYAWIVILSENTKKKLVDQIYIPYNCEFYIIQPTDQSSKYQILKLHHVKPKTRIIQKFFASWNPETGLNAQGIPSEQNRPNMEKIHLTLETQDELPCSNHLECYQREIWDDMSNLINFTTVPIPKSKMGHEHPDAYIKITSLNSITFKENMIAPIIVTEIKFYIRYEKQNLLGWEALSKPFSQNLWTAISIWFIITTLTIVMVGYLQTIIRDKFIFTDYFFTTLDSITNQEGSMTSHKSSVRITLIAIRITSAIILPAYSAAITSFLTISLPKIPFRNLYSFAEDGSYTIGSINNSYPIRFLQETDDPKLIVIREKYLIPINEMPRNHKEAVGKICNENFAFMGYNNQLETILPLFPNACRILEITPPLFILPTGILLADNSPYTDVFFEKLISFYESGILNLINKKVQNKDFKVAQDQKQDFRPLIITAVQPILLIGMIGLIISSITLILEFIWFNKMNIGPHSPSKLVTEHDRGFEKRVLTQCKW